MTIFLSSEICFAFSLRSETQETVLVLSLVLAGLELELGGETLNRERFATARPELVVA